MDKENRTSSSPMLLCVCFLKRKIQRFHGTMGKDKCQAYCFSLFLQLMLIFIVLENSKICLESP